MSLSACFFFGRGLIGSVEGDGADELEDQAIRADLNGTSALEEVSQVSELCRFWVIGRAH